MGITALVFSLGAVVLAEMGDKTQLLAMAFAAKYKATKVMIGVFLATILNHALAVAVGHMLTRFETIQVWIQGIAALSFIFFGLWTIRGDKLDGEENKTTMAIAFFIAEMGDKTQLTTVALAAKFPTNPLWILAGTTLGMLIADGIGIIIGVVLCKKIPERTVKLISAAVFIFFGFLGSYQVMRSDLGLNTDIIMLVMTLLYALTAAATIYLLKKESSEGTADSVSPACCQVKKEI